MNRNEPIPKSWWDWYLSPPIDYRKVYGEPFKWTAQEKMLMQELEKQKKQKEKT